MAAWDRVRIDACADMVEYVLDNGRDRANVYWLEADGRVFFVAQEDPRTGANRAEVEEMPEMDVSTVANVRDRVRELVTRNGALLEAMTPAERAAGDED